MGRGPDRSETNASVTSTKDVVENFTIGFDAVTTKSAMLIMSWDQVKVAVPFTVTTDEQMAVIIDKVMAGPSANDYYRAADYYLNENIEQEKALEYMNKAIELRGNAPFWMLRKKSLILANLGRYKEAIAVAEESLKAAESAGNQAYVDMNKKSIKLGRKNSLLLYDTYCLAEPIAFNNNEVNTLRKRSEVKNARTREVFMIKVHFCTVQAVHFDPKLFRAIVQVKNS